VEAETVSQLEIFQGHITAGQSSDSCDSGKRHTQILRYSAAQMFGCADAHSQIHSPTEREQQVQLTLAFANGNALKACTAVLSGIYISSIEKNIYNFD